MPLVGNVVIADDDVAVTPRSRRGGGTGVHQEAGARGRAVRPTWPMEMSRHRTGGELPPKFRLPRVLLVVIFS